MEFAEAKGILDACERTELRDHAFGDRVISWTKRGYEVAYGYSGSSGCGVHIVGDSSFEGDEAKDLVNCGTLVHTQRNDSTGPEDYVEGRIMPGLTRESVKQELIMKKRLDEKDWNNYKR